MYLRIDKRSYQNKSLHSTTGGTIRSGTHVTSYHPKNLKTLEPTTHLSISNTFEPVMSKRRKG